MMGGKTKTLAPMLDIPSNVLIYLCVEEDGVDGLLWIGTFNEEMACQQADPSAEWSYKLTCHFALNVCISLLVRTQEFLDNHSFFLLYRVNRVSAGLWLR